MILNLKCVESANPKDITDIMSFQLHVDIHFKLFPLLKTMIVESTCLRVKDLDLYIIETACISIKISLILFLNIKSFYLINQ